MWCLRWFSPLSEVAGPLLSEHLVPWRRSTVCTRRDCRGDGVEMLLLISEAVIDSEGSFACTSMVQLLGLECWWGLNSSTRHGVEEKRRSSELVP